MPERYVYRLQSSVREAGAHMPPGEYVGHVVPEVPPRRVPWVRLYFPDEPERSVVARGRDVVRIGPADG